MIDGKRIERFFMLIVWIVTAVFCVASALALVSAVLWLLFAYYPSNVVMMCGILSVIVFFAWTWSE